MKYLLTALVSLAVGGFAGGYLGGKGGTILGMCEMGKVALDLSYLPKDKVMQLAEDTGFDLQKRYPGIAKRLKLSDAMRERASLDSNCSQMLTRMSAGMDKAGS